MFCILIFYKVHFIEACNVLQAIEWAEKLDEMHNGINPAYACPYTRVYKLVKHLRKYFNLDN